MYILLEDGHGIRTVKEVLGQSKKTTKLFNHGMIDL